MNKYEISIIIPHYNTPVLLDKLLDSIPCSNHLIQVIVVDDNSNKETDVFESVIKKHSELELEVFENFTGKNSAGTCRNIGLEHAKGKWILFADSDDYFTEGWLDIVLPYTEEDYDIVFFKPISIDLATGNLGNRHFMYSGKVDAYISDPSYNNALLLRYAFPVPWSKLIKRELIENNAIKFQPVRMCDDEMFSLFCGHKASKIACSSDTIYVVTCRPDSLTKNLSEEFYLIKQSVYAEKYSFIYKYLSSEDIHFLNMDFIPLYLIYDTLIGGHGAKNAMKLRRYFRENGVPLVNKPFVSIGDLLKRLFSSLRKRYKAA